MDQRTSKARSANNTVVRSAALSAEHLRSQISALSDFRTFLTDNHDLIVEASGGYKIDWTAFMNIPEICEREFRTKNGGIITPAAASRVWYKVRRDVASRRRAKKPGA